MTRIEYRCRIAAAAMLSTLAGACSSAGSTERAPAPHDLLVRAAEFAFSAPDTVPAGVTTVRLDNGGTEMHHLQLVRIGEGHTYEEYRQRAIKGNPLPAWVVPVGGPNESSAGVPAKVVLDLRVGQYAMLCFIPSDADRTPHFKKGMMRPLVVVPSGAGGAGEPAVDGRIVLADYSFTVSPALRAGRHTLRVENTGAQPHELILARHAPGKTMNDLLRWVKEKDGPPPGEPAGGTTAFSPGGVNFLTADFAAGEYVMRCFVPDASDGRAHFAHGMVRHLQVN